MNREELRAELIRRRENNKILIKRALTIIVAALVLVLEVYGAVTLAEIGFFVSNEPVPSVGYEIYPDADYERDIMKDDAYLDILNREPLISLYIEATRETETLMPDEYEKRGKAVELFCKLILAIQAGDADTYNSCFSDAYLIEEGKKYAANDDDPSIYEGFTDEQYKNLGKEESFTMQQIYDAVITRVSEVENPQTKRITYTYRLKYKIRQNNGTLRVDMGSDCFREQTIVLLENEQTGDPEIYSVTTTSATAFITVVYGWRIALVCVGGVVISFLTVFATVLIFKKLKKSKTQNK